MRAFSLQRPASVDEAARLLAADPGARLLAGGTDLVPNLRRGLEAPAVLVDLGRVAAFDAVASEDDGLRLGAGVKLARLAGDESIAARYPALAAAARAIAGPGHRSAATVGGNLCLDTRCVFYNQSAWWRAANGFCLKRGGTVCHVAPQGTRCHAAFAGDLAAPLLAYGAAVDVVSVRGARRLPLADLYRDDGAAHLTLARDDFGDFGRTEPVAVIDTLGVDPEYARRGVGRALLSQLFANLGALRVERLETIVAYDDLALAGVFGACGFVPSQRLAFVPAVGR